MLTASRLRSGAHRLGRGLSSPRFAILLLILIALLSTGGSLPSGAGGGDVPAWLLTGARLVGFLETFSSPLFLALVGMLFLSVGFCTWSRLQLRRRAAAGSPLLSRRLLPWLDVGVHIAVLVVIVGGVMKSTLGFLGTELLVVGVPTNTVFDWRSESEVLLDFAVIARQRTVEYHPAMARIGVRDAASGEKVALVELVEGREEAVPGTGVRVKVLGLDRERSVLRLQVGGGSAVETVVELGTDPATAAPAAHAGRDYLLVAYRQDIRTVRSLLQFIEHGSVVREEWIGPNASVVHRGMSMFQTSWGEDDQGRPFVGIQISRDPASPLFWAGCIALSLLLPLFLLTRHARPGSPAGKPAPSGTGA